MTSGLLAEAPLMGEGGEGDEEEEGEQSWSKAYECQCDINIRGI